MNEWIYSQIDGSLRFNNEIIGFGYSGKAEGRNNPLFEHIHKIGPIPRGTYAIGPSYHHEKLGRVVMNIDPINHDALGRTDFRIHGDNKEGDASEGCIILNYDIRNIINNSGNKVLIVI